MASSNQTIPHGAVFRIDEKSYNNPEQVQQLRLSLKKIEESPVGQKLFNALLRTDHVSMTARIVIKSPQKSKNEESVTAMIVPEKGELWIDMAKASDSLYPAKLDDSGQLKGAESTPEQLLVHEMSHFLDSPKKGTKLDISTLEKHACFEAKGMEWENEWLAHAGLPKREAYADMGVEMEMTLRRQPEMQETFKNPEFINSLRNIVVKEEMTNNGCAPLDFQAVAQRAVKKLDTLKKKWVSP